MMKRALLTSSILCGLSAAALAQPVCNPAIPNADQCLDNATTLLPTDIIRGTQTQGPKRRDQTVKIPLSALPPVIINSPLFAPAARAASPALSPATPTIIGGIKQPTQTAHQWINGIGNNGVPILSQPVFGDVAGTAALAQLPTGSSGAALPVLNAAQLTWAGRNIWNAGAGTNVTLYLNTTPGFLNGLVQSGDALYGATNGSVDTGGIVIAPWSHSNYGLRTDGAGNTQVNGLGIQFNLGTGLLSGNLNLPNPINVGGTVYCAQYASIQACHDASPAGSKLILPPFATITQVATTVISKANVTVSCPGWSTVIRRSAVFDQLMIITGAGSSVRDCAFDGNAGNFQGVHSEISIDGTNSLADHIKVFNYTTQIGIGVSGFDASVLNSTVKGTGDQRGGYGIWAISGNPVLLQGNIVSDTFIDAIGFGGTGARAIGNHISHSQCQTGVLGAQLALYPGWYGMIAEGNVVEKGCATTASGISTTGYAQLVNGNQILFQQNNSLGANVNDAATGGATFTNNIIIDGGQATGNAPCMLLDSGDGTFIFSNNKCIDDQVTPTMNTGIFVTAGSQDNFNVTGNIFKGIATPINDQSSGIHKIYANNSGVDDASPPSVACGNVLSTGFTPSVIITGVSTVHFLNAVNGLRWINRHITMLPTAACVFASDQNIANAFTATPGVAIDAYFDGTLWHLK